MNAKFDVSLMVKVAQRYYIDGLKQEEIAKEVQISRSLISMILTEAKEAGIVEINIRNPMLNNDELSGELETLFPVNKCVVVPTAVQEAGVLRKLVSQRATELVNRLIFNQAIIGLAWGRTCYEFVSLYKSEQAYGDVNVVPLIGGSSQNPHYFQINEMTRILAEKLGGTANFIHAPSLAATLEEKELFLRSSVMQNIIEKWDNMDIVISGIGTLPFASTADRETYAGENELNCQLEKNHAVGDICARYFDMDGNFLGGEQDRLIGIPAEELKKAGNVICLAAGREKAHAIIGALKTGVVRTLVTDEQTAKAVLKLYKTI